VEIENRIYEDLVSLISCGKLRPSEAMPSLRKLASQYKIPVNNVRRTIDRLQSDGLVEKQHGKGVFVADPGSRAKRVMLISHLDGDLFSDFARTFAQIFSQHHDFLLQLEEQPMTDDAASILESKIADASRNARLDAIFFIGNDLGRTDFLSKYQKKVKLFCIFLKEKLVNFRCPYAVSDWAHGGKIGVCHLYESGSRNLLIITHPIDIYSERNVHNDFLSSCRQTVAELGMSSVELHKRVKDNDYVKTVRDILIRQPEINGIFSLGDYMLAPLYPLMNELGRKIGKDIALLGYYNTPWTSVLHPELTSINVFPDRIVETVCDMYFNSSEDKHRYVLPEVIVRESSSLAKN
jgi:DNA-binding LacI/PurR family transcriptional regulator